MIVRLDLSHIAQTVEIEELSFSEPWSEQALADSLKSPFARFYAYIINSRVVGYMGMYAVSGEGSVTNVACHPDYRRMGIALALVENAIAVGKELGLEYITLEVRKSNEPAIQLYKKCGFAEMGIRKGFYSSPREDALVMNYFFEKDTHEDTCN